MEERPFWFWSTLAMAALLPIEIGAAMLKPDVINPYWLIGCGLFLFLVCLFGLLLSRNKPTNSNAFKCYLKKKIKEAEKIKKSVSVKNLKEKATAIWQWEEGLARGITSALGPDEAQILLGKDSDVLSRSKNWKDTEGQWILYRTWLEGDVAVSDFRNEISKIISYLHELSEKTLSNDLIETFDPRDLAEF